MAKDKIYRVTRWTVLKVKCTPHFEDMYDEKEFFEERAGIGEYMMELEKNKARVEISLDELE